MPEATLEININGNNIRVPEGCTVAAALARANESSFRTSVRGEARFPLCGMGICFECRVTINGVAQQKACETVCTAQMVVETS